VGFSLVGYVSANRDPGAGDGLVSPQHWDWLLEDLARRQPTYVLDTAGARLRRWGFPLEERRLLARSWPPPTSLSTWSTTCASTVAAAAARLERARRRSGRALLLEGPLPRRGWRRVPPLRDQGARTFRGGLRCPVLLLRDVSPWPQARVRPYLQARLGLT
jgi:hypothetical protein